MNLLPIKIEFKDRDGSLIMSRKSNSWWYEDNETHLKNSIDQDARERGVRVVSHNYKYSWPMKVEV